MVALFNICGYFVIFMTIWTISILSIGEYLIGKLNLETKYPKIAKYIKIKQKLYKAYFTFYIIWLYLIVILCIIANFYMLLLKYFV